MATPIDFQILYTQAANIAQSISGQQNAAQLSEYSQQQKIAQRNLENSKKVQQTSAENSDTASVNENGRNGSGAYKGYGQKRQNNTDTIDSDDSYDRVKEAHLGNIIDITR